MQKALLFFIFITSLNVFSQDTIRTRRIANVSYTPNDFFINYGGACGNVNHTLFLGFGINRTIFQGRFYPEIAYQYSHDFEVVNKLHILPYAKLSFNRLKVTTAGAHYWVNPELGMNFEFGNRKRFGLGIGYRSLFEFWRQDKRGLNSTDFGITGNIYFVLP